MKVDMMIPSRDERVDPGEGLGGVLVIAAQDAPGPPPRHRGRPRAQRRLSMRRVRNVLEVSAFSFLL